MISVIRHEEHSFSHPSILQPRRSCLCKESHAGPQMELRTQPDRPYWRQCVPSLNELTKRLTAAKFLFSCNKFYVEHVENQLRSHYLNGSMRNGSMDIPIKNQLHCMTVTFKMNQGVWQVETADAVFFSLSTCRVTSLGSSSGTSASFLKHSAVSL